MRPIPFNDMNCISIRGQIFYYTNNIMILSSCTVQDREYIYTIPIILWYQSDADKDAHIYAHRND